MEQKSAGKKEFAKNILILVVHVLFILYLIYRVLLLFSLLPHSQLTTGSHWIFIFIISVASFWYAQQLDLKGLYWAFAIFILPYIIDRIIAFSGSSFTFITVAILFLLVNSPVLILLFIGLDAGLISWTKRERSSNIQNDTRAVNNKKDKQSAYQTKMKKYHNKKWHLSLDYPEDWQIVWENQSEGEWEIIVGIAGKPSRAGKPFVTIRRLPHAVINFEPAHVSVFAVGGPGESMELPRSPEEYNAVCKRELEKVLPGVHFISEETGVLSEMPYAKLVYNYAGNNGSIREQQINLFSRDVTFRLLAELPEDQIEFAEKFFDKVVSNFQPFPAKISKRSAVNKIRSFSLNPSSCLSVVLKDANSLGPAGPGGSHFQDAIQCLNNRDDQQAMIYLNKALKQGLDPLRQGYTHADLGEIYLRKNEIENAMNQFIKVLNFKEALYESVHKAAQYLSVIYRELDKPEVVNSLEQLKYKTTSKLNYSLSPEAVDRVRRLTIENRDRLINQTAPEGELNQITVKKNENQGIVEKSAVDDHDISIRKSTQKTIKCKRCNKGILTKQQFISELATKHGIEVDPHNVDHFNVSGVAASYDAYSLAVESVKTKYEAVQKKRAFQCINCGNMYCMECLLHYAPTHSNGGKGCLVCRSAFAEI